MSSPTAITYDYNRVVLIVVVIGWKTCWDQFCWSFGALSAYNVHMHRFMHVGMQIIVQYMLHITCIYIDMSICTYIFLYIDTCTNHQVCLDIETQVQVQQIGQAIWVGAMDKHGGFSEGAIQIRHQGDKPCSLIQ